MIKRKLVVIILMMLLLCSCAEENKYKVQQEMASWNEAWVKANQEAEKRRADYVCKARLDGRYGIADAIENRQVILGMTLEEFLLSKNDTGCANLGKFVHTWGTYQTIRCQRTYYYLKNGIVTSYSN